MSILYSESYNTFFSQLIRGLGFERPFVSMIIQNVTECSYLYVQIYNLSYSVSKIYLEVNIIPLSGALISTWEGVFLFLSYNNKVKLYLFYRVDFVVRRKLQVFSM